MNLKSLGARVIVRPVNDKPDGSIVLPDTVTEETTMGIVVNVGPGAVLETGVRMPVGAEIGQKVLFSSFHGFKVKVGGEDFIILNEKDLIAIIE
jgi:chaperonin GroES